MAKAKDEQQAMKQLKENGMDALKPDLELENDFETSDLRQFYYTRSNPSAPFYFLYPKSEKEYCLVVIYYKSDICLKLVLKVKMIYMIYNYLIAYLVSTKY